MWSRSSFEVRARATALFCRLDVREPGSMATQSKGWLDLRSVLTGTGRQTRLAPPTLKRPRRNYSSRLTSTGSVPVSTGTKPKLPSCIAKQTRFAEAQFDGRGVARDPAGSRAWLEKAARQGYARAECELGVTLKDGLDIAQDLPNGLRYLQSAARLGDAYAEDYLGRFAESGLISDPSPSEAYMHYLKASEMGSAWGTYNVARMHEHGIGVDKSPTEALRWYMKVASIGDPDLLGQWSDLRYEAGAVAGANFRIGDMY